MIERHIMTRGGPRKNAGRPKGTTKPEDQKTKPYTFRLYRWEVKTVKNFIKSLRNKNQTSQEAQEGG